MSHTCTLRSKTVWRDDLTASGGWQISQYLRLRVCAECGQEQGATPTGQRRRQRVTLPPNQREPSALRPAVPVRQWGSITAILAKLPGNRLEVEQQLQEWLIDGWVEVEERQEKYGQTWQLAKARLSEVAYERLVARPANAQANEAARFITELLSVLDGWEADVAQARLLWAGDSVRTAILDRIAVILPDQIAALKQGLWRPLPDTNQQTGGSVHQRWLRILRGLAALLTSEETVYERAFAARWLGDSKGLARDKQPLADYLGVDWEWLGLYRHTPVVLCWGNFVGEFRGYEVDGRAGSPFVALSAETVKSVTAVHVHARAILIIENQTAFEALLQPTLRQNDILYLFGSGHAGYAERSLVKTWLTAQPDLPWYVWTDWDLGGVRIQIDWAQWAEKQGLLPPEPWLWDDAVLAKWQVWGRPLEPEILRQLVTLQHPLAHKLMRLNCTIEQEAILSDLNAYLPI